MSNVDPAVVTDRAHEPSPAVSALRVSPTNVEMAPSLKPYDDGSYLLYRKLPRGLSLKIGGNKLPRFRHTTLASAEKEAARLLIVFPESTFIVLREVGTVKLRAATEA